MIVIFLTVMRSGIVHQSKLRAPAPFFPIVFCLRGRRRMASHLHEFLKTNHVLIANHVFKILNYVL